MSLTLADQKLGSHSGTDSTSHKFMLKGRQSGGMHRGHAWVFRAESYDTMIAWFNDIKALTENTGEAKAVFIRKHARSLSAGSQKAPGSISSDGLDEEDEADQVPYSATPSVVAAGMPEDSAKKPERPNPGGRFPSALNINRDSSLAPSSPSSNGAATTDRDVIAAAVALPEAAGKPFENHEKQVKAAYQESRDEAKGSTQSALASPVDRDNEKMVAMPSGEEKEQSAPVAEPQGYIPMSQKSHHNGLPIQQGPNPLTSPPPSEIYNTEPVQAQGVSSEGPGGVAYASPSAEPKRYGGHLTDRPLERHDSTNYGNWLGTTATSAAGSKLHHHDESNRTPQNPTAEPETAASERTTSPTIDNSIQSAPAAAPPPGAIYASSTAPILPTTVAHMQSQQTPITAAVLPVTGPPEDPFRESRSRASSMGAGAALTTVNSTSTSGKADLPEGVAYAANIGAEREESGTRGPSAADNFMRRPSTIKEVMTPSPTGGGSGAEKGDPMDEVVMAVGK